MINLLYACVEYESRVLGSERGRSDQDGLDYVMKDAPSSYANKLSRMSLNMANPQKLDTNVPNDADIWLLLASANEVNDRTKNYIYGYFIGKSLAFPVVEWFVRNNWKKYGLEKVTLVKGFFFFKFSFIGGVDSVLRDGPWTIHGFPIFLNKWSPFMSLLKEELSRVRVWVKFHDVIGNLVMSVPNIGEPRYLEGTICVDYEWELPCCSMCLIFSHSVVDFPKAPKRKVNRVDKRKGGSSEADDEGFIEVKREEIEWVDYLDDHDNEDKVEPVDNKMADFMASKLSGLDMEIPDHIQSICDNFDIKVRSQKKK
nr:hypothetical protein [Tanacetum cinerariifolium]